MNLSWAGWKADASMTDRSEPKTCEKCGLGALESASKDVFPGGLPFRFRNGFRWKEVLELDPREE
jgi:hypothetical protein